MPRTIGRPPPTAGAHRFRATGLRLVLEDRGIKTTWLARRAGITDGHLVNILSGRRTASGETADAIAAALALPLFLLFDFAEANKKFAPIDGGEADG